MTEPAHPLARRQVLRHAGTAALGGAALLGATAQPAAAADGDVVRLGADLDASTTTRIEMGDRRDRPVLSLANADGPSLRLEPTDPTDDPLAVGDIQNTDLGPNIGVTGTNGPVTTFLATGHDLGALPLLVPVAPVRVLDTRMSSGRELVVGTSENAWTTDHRLRGGAWIDIAVDTVSEHYTVNAVFINLTSVASADGGFLSAYPPGPRPGISSLNFPRRTTTANASFVATGSTDGYHVVRVYTSTTTHLLVDLTGSSISDVISPATANSAKPRRTNRQTKAMQHKGDVGPGHQ